MERREGGRERESWVGWGAVGCGRVRWWGGGAVGGKTKRCCLFTSYSS